MSVVCLVVVALNHIELFHSASLNVKHLYISITIYSKFYENVHILELFCILHIPQWFKERESKQQKKMDNKNKSKIGVFLGALSCEFMCMYLAVKVVLDLAIFILKVTYLTFCKIHIKGKFPFCTQQLDFCGCVLIKNCNFWNVQQQQQVLHSN